MKNKKFIFPNSHNFIFFKGQRAAFTPKDITLVSDWAEKNFILTTAYAMQGRFKCFPWERELLNFILYYDEVYLIGAVQTGKSLLAEIICAYLIDNYNYNMMFCYEKQTKVMDVFTERLAPMIREIPALRKYWSGIEDDLTKQKIKLRNCIIRIASAAVRSDISTHNASFVYGSEVAKWPKKDFDQIRMLKGRQQASRMLGKQIKALFETSPIDEEDKSYGLTHSQEVLFVNPMMPCPHCGGYQLLTDSQVKEIPNKKGKCDHNPKRILMDNAAYYECEHCQKKILDKHRFEMMERVVWAAKGEKIKDGKVINRERYLKIAANWSRFVDVSWSFSECLAAYFNALQSPDGESLRTYQNEDMARWLKTKALLPQQTEQYIDKKKLKYYQAGPKAYVPDGVSFALYGMDTQDNGWYLVIRGFGKGNESWLLRQKFLKCELEEDGETGDKAKMLSIVKDGIFGIPLMKKDGRSVPIVIGVIDRGGHRSEDVDYICQNIPNLFPYMGGAENRTGMKLVEQKDSGIIFGHKQNISKLTWKQISSNVWHLPDDIDPDYRRQVLNQYEEELFDNRGNKKRQWVEKDPDHYRDCENYIVVASHFLGLQGIIHDESLITKFVSNFESTQMAERQEGEPESQVDTVNEQKDESSNQEGAAPVQSRVKSNYLDGVMGSGL